MTEISLSRLAVIFIASTFLGLFVLDGNWQKQRVLAHDSYGYYSFLPALFIHKDLTFSYLDLPENQIWPAASIIELPEGQKVQKGSVGMAIMYAPFFGIAHGIARVTGAAATGYSPLYHFFIGLSAIVYAVVGLSILRRILLSIFDESIVAITLLALALGSNFLVYSFLEGPMPHVAGFFLICLFIYFSCRWVQTFRWSDAMVCAISMGLIILIRPTNALVAIIPALYGVTNSRSFTERIGSLRAHYYQVLVMLCVAGFLLLPQFLYWKLITGQWFFYTYIEEGFFFSDPKILEGLFSYRKGWILYSPVMSIAIIGLFFMGKNRKLAQYQVAIPVFLVLNLYVIFSWWTWWYGGSFGARPLVDSSAVMAISMGACLSVCFQNRLLKPTVLFFLLLTVSLNIFQSLQYSRGVIHWDGMTREAYWAVFAHSSAPDNLEKLLKRPDYDAAKSGDR